MKARCIMGYDADRTRKAVRAAEHRGVSERWIVGPRYPKAGNIAYVDRTSTCTHREMVSKFSGCEIVN